MRSIMKAAGRLLVKAAYFGIFLVAFAQAAAGRNAVSPQPEKKRPAQLTREDAAVITEANHLRKQLGDRLWPGFSEIAVPMVYVTQDYEYAIGFPKTLQGFQSAEVGYLPGEKVQVRKRTFETSKEAAFDVDGVDALVIGTPENTKKSPAEWVLIATHEMFHVYQTAHGSDAKTATLKLGSATDASWQLNYPFPYQDEDVMRLIQVQSYVTYLSVTDPDNESTKFIASNVMDAVKVYQSFLKCQDPSGQLYNYSRFQEWVEGIALYTEYKMAEAAALGDYGPTPDFSRLLNLKSYQQVWNEKYKNKLFLIKFAGRIARSRTVFYPLGFGKGLLLDRLMPDWKSKYFAADIWLDDLLLRTANGAK